MGTELDLDGLLRMDPATQADTLVKLVGGAITAPNEARKRMNYGPITGGNTVYLQQQNYSLDALAKRDARPDPFSTSGNTDPAPAPSPAQPAAEPDEDEIEDQARMLASMIAKELSDVEYA
jgi:phage portal protein BeeE